LGHCDANSACQTVNPKSTLTKLNIPNELTEEMLSVLNNAGKYKLCVYITQKHEFSEYTSMQTHISIDEYSSDAFKYFADNNWGAWDFGEPNVASGNCVSRVNGKMRLANCLKKLPFVCEM